MNRTDFQYQNIQRARPKNQYLFQFDRWTETTTRIHHAITLFTLDNKGMTKERPLNHAMLRGWILKITGYNLLLVRN
jgi:hypothetical protein